MQNLPRDMDNIPLTIHTQCSVTNSLYTKVNRGLCATKVDIVQGLSTHVIIFKQLPLYLSDTQDVLAQKSTL